MGLVALILYINASFPESLVDTGDYIAKVQVAA